MLALCPFWIRCHTSARSCCGGRIFADHRYLKLKEFVCASCLARYGYAASCPLRSS